MANKEGKWTDPKTGIQIWSNYDNTIFWLQEPGKKKYKYDNPDILEAHYKSLTEPKLTEPKLTEVQKRNKRLGISQAEYDSTMASKNFPQYKTGVQLAEEKRKQAEKDKKKTDTAKKKTDTAKKKSKDPAKVITYIDKYKTTLGKLDKLEISNKEGTREYKLLKKSLDGIQKKAGAAGVGREFLQWYLEEFHPMRTPDLPDRPKPSADQIFEDPDTGKRYRFIGPDINDPNSYEEI